MSRDYSDQERQRIANEEYSVYESSDPMTIKNDKGELEDIGTVRQVIENDTGLKVYVVESPDKSLWYTISKSVHDIFVEYHKGDVMKILKIIGIVLASLLVIVGLSIGGYKVMKQVEHDEMVRVVKGEEVKKIIEDNLKLRHKGALEEGNIIQNYDIDINSIFHSPMGGIKFKIYINNDEELYVFFTINKDRSSGKLVNDGGGNSAKFEKMITEEKSE